MPIVIESGKARAFVMTDQQSCPLNWRRHDCWSHDEGGAGLTQATAAPSTVVGRGVTRENLTGARQ